MESIEEKYYRMDIGWHQVRKVSVIMPVYNTGKYLRQSLDSLVNQTFKNFDVICVDDASVDSETKCILEEYRNTYDFIHVIYLNANVGAGEARNIGFCKATGEYVIFLDADDIFYPCMLEIMYDSIRQDDADVCICGYEFFCDEDKTDKFTKEIMKARRYDKSNLEEDWLLYNSPNPWTKLCKRSLLQENGICFQSVPACNDVYWSCMIQIKAKKVCFLEEKILIRYRISNPKQITEQKSVISIYDAMAEVVQAVQAEKMGREIMSAVILLFIWLEMGEIRIAKDIGNIKECHCLTRLFLADKVCDILYKSQFYNGLLRSFMQSDFIEKRFPWKMTFLEQISLNEERLLKILEQGSEVAVWGNGKRSEAFQEFCKVHSIKLWGVADSKNIDIHKRTAYGYKIVSTEEVLHHSDLLVASNTEIFQELAKIVADQKRVIIDLQDFCPLGKKKLDK